MNRCARCAAVDASLAEVFRVLRSMAEVSRFATDAEVGRSGMLLGLAAFVADELKGHLFSAAVFADWARRKRIISTRGELIVIPGGRMSEEAGPGEVPQASPSPGVATRFIAKSWHFVAARFPFSLVSRVSRSVISVFSNRWYP